MMKSEETWPTCKECGEKLILDRKEEGWKCGNCNLVYHLDRGELIGPMIPMTGGEEGKEQGQPASAPPHARLDEDEFRDFLKYQDARGPGRDAYKTASKSVKEGMLESWIKMGKPTPSEG